MFFIPKYPFFCAFNFEIELKYNKNEKLNKTMMQLFLISCVRKKLNEI
jgi:hypothetical protein